MSERRRVATHAFSAMKGPRLARALVEDRRRQRWVSTPDPMVSA
jgi:hypothetical protein